MNNVFRFVADFDDEYFNMYFYMYEETGFKVQLNLNKV